MAKTLIVDLCKDKNSLHYDEFVKPVEDIVEPNSRYSTVHFKELPKEDLKQYKKIILCGVALKDFEYINNIEHFKNLKQTSSCILGICAGAHVIGKLYDCPMEEGKEIGLIKIDIKKQDKILQSTNLSEIYSLHSLYINPSNDFEIIATSSNYPQILKHKKKNIYAILFHPEVRNKEIITNFINL